MKASNRTSIWLVAGLSWLASADTFRGIEVAPEHGCTPYSHSDYPYSQRVEQRIVASLGAIFGPYTGACFASIGDTDIEHMVATREAHDSGLCAASAATKAAFAIDLLNLTLASPKVNRHQKSAKDVAEWTPDRNACWFTARTLEVRRKYGLTIDRREAEAVEDVLSECKSTEMVVVPCGTAAVPVTRPASTSAAMDDDVDALALWDDKRNGGTRAPKRGGMGLPRCDWGIPRTYVCDGDNDGMVCE